MLQRYIGNKQQILPEVLAAISHYARPGQLVCDAFSGTLAVSLALKAAGYKVASNDSNFFSYIYGLAYLRPHTLPEVASEAIIGRREHHALSKEAKAQIDHLQGQPGFHFLRKPQNALRYAGLLTLIRFLQGVEEAYLPRSERRSHIFSTYTEQGNNSAFVSLRGTEGRRRFFSAENGKRIDIILNILRLWWREKQICDQTHATLACVLMDAIGKVSNTQGTYHDFPRGFIDQRALKPITLLPPAMDGALSSRLQHILGCEEDSTEFIKKIPSHAVLYLDPPYNFRQYSAYYFLPNVICKYHTIIDLDSYFAGVKHVRGQNMDDSFDSVFCKRNAFIPALEQLVSSSKARVVVLSYFDGRNHWNDHINGSGTKGFQNLSAFFKSGLFQRGSFSNQPVSRQNYQSYGGYKADRIAEYILSAKRK